MKEQGQHDIPRHIAIIMDGNGRWARERGFSSRIKGHEAGAESVRTAIRCCRDAGVKYLTLYAFSVENWKRSPGEISALMSLLSRFMKNNEHELHENRVRLLIAGRIEDLPDAIRQELRRVMEATRHYDEGHLILALSYGGRSELADAMRKIGEKIQAGELSPGDITEETIRQHLYLPAVPDPDLMIRTSGEQRLSNFLLWQLSYAEFYFEPAYWPDFREEHFNRALAAYAKRSRRYGDAQ